MKSVLIVDDEQPFLESVKLGFKMHKADFKLYTAANGQLAIEVLESRAIDIIVTDVKMPVMDGFELLAHISNKYPTLPVIVMSAYADSAMKKKIMRMGTLGLLEKPLDFDDLAAMIAKYLRMTARKTALDGIALESFLQLIQLEQTTYLLKVSPRHQPESSGYIYTFNGELYSAVCSELKGEKAIFEILSWDKPRISVKKSPPQKFNRNIRRSMMSILLEASTKKDESAWRPPEADTHSVSVGSVNAEAKNNSSTKTTTAAHFPNREVLEKSLNILQALEGYRASALLAATGEVIASDMADETLPLDSVVALFNNVFKQAHGACDKSGLKSVNSLVIRSSHGKVMMLCPGSDTQAHFHLIVFTTIYGDLELLEMSLRKIATKILQKL